MVGHGGSSAGLYLADPTSPIPSHCASIVVTSSSRVGITYKNYTRIFFGKYICSTDIQCIMHVRDSTKKNSNHHANLPLEMYSFTL